MAKSMTRKSSLRRQVFSLAAPEASRVQLVGDFTQWNQSPINMIKESDGTWRAAITLEPGSHSYRFIVDGVWRDDPDCPIQEPNPYGGQNAVRKVT